MRRDKDAVYHAVCMDPLTSAVLSLDEIEEMVKEMFEQNKDYIPWYKGL